MSGNIAGSLLAIIILPLGILYPSLMIYYLWKNPDPSTQTTTLTERLKIKTLASKICHLLELFRLYLTVCFLVLFRETPALQIILLYILTLLKQGYLLICQPFYEKRENILAIVNESLVTASLFLYAGLALNEVLEI
jgi:hypothetical protein